MDHEYKMPLVIYNLDQTNMDWWNLVKMHFLQFQKVQYSSEFYICNVHEVVVCDAVLSPTRVDLNFLM